MYLHGDSARVVGGRFPGREKRARELLGALRARAWLSDSFFFSFFQGKERKEAKERNLPLLETKNRL
jgi:hypothetical protein